MAGQTSDTPAPPHGPVRSVSLLDAPLTRVRRPMDLVLMLTTLVAVVVVLALSVYAYGTTTGVTRDVQSVFSQVVRNILLLPMNAIEGFLTLILPIVVIVDQILRRQARNILDALAAAFAAVLVTAGASWLLESFAPEEVLRALHLLEGGEWVMTVTPMVAGLAAFLTAIGTRSRRRLVAISWNLLWIVLVVSVIAGEATLVGALVSVLLGRAVGLGMRYASGVRSERAHGITLVEGIRRAGVDAVSVIRIGDTTDHAALPRETITVSNPIGYVPEGMTANRATAARVEAEEAAARAADDHGSTLLDGTEPTHARSGTASTDRTDSDSDSDSSDDKGATPPPSWASGSTGAAEPPAVPDHVQDSATVATEREGANRVYAVTDADGVRWDAVVLDADRQVIGWLNALLSTLARRGLDRRATVSLRQSAERASLMYYAAAAAGVNCPRLHGIAEAGASVLLLGEHVPGARQVSDIAAESITDEMMHSAWEQLGRAHRAGLAHRNISADTVHVVTSGGRAGEVWLNGWEEGEIASGSLARRVDLAQLLTLFALRVGAERAVAAASRALSIARLAEIAPLLQPIALPAQTRTEARAAKDLMAELRTHLVAFIPTAGHVQPIQIARFTARTAITLTVAVVAGWVVLTTLNFQQIADVVAQANPLWLVVAFAFGLLTYLGSAMGLVALSPDRLGLWRTILVQVAASVITLVAPAGVGPAALNLRFMQKRGVQTPVALATVALLQVSQFVTTVLLLLAIALLTGSSSALQQLPSGAVLVVVGAVLVLAGAVFAVGSLRRWVIKKTKPTLQQVWPRLVWVIGQPHRIVMAIGGNLIMTIGFLAAFGAALAAFGQSLPLTSLAVVFLTGTAVGSAIPTPGGIGTVEFALSTGLTTAGIATAAAASVAVLFRVLTFWIRVPLGWWALRYLQRREVL
ncbi:lysylphosphatidylglycerol synthase transmembrane domain-containing protein [Ruania halotolerans]|uniref:lysylphosphatidylglycerol synthase transmembrane domain-containing protein n=1 Tax=Ruania halotolerans TaxID=2897773 RepID=UPI001E50D990|nr:lysylphosphatidylglycerol synthase transmembrane domain-containing protein [Ruania halotolerans]UFU06379.1 flippase-like domain-containing protein [Ruania halotolerans]